MRASLTCRYNSINLFHLRRINLLARTKSFNEELALHRKARERKGFLKVLASSFVLATAKLEFAKRRWVKRIGCEQVAVFNRADFS
jgi:hypothetical protein